LRIAAALVTLSVSWLMSAPVHPHRSAGPRLSLHPALVERESLDARARPLTRRMLTMIEALGATIWGSRSRRWCLSFSSQES
jgi:hypothetical protein